MSKIINKFKFIALIILIGCSSFTNASKEISDKDVSSLYNFSNQQEQNFLFTFLHHWMSLRKIVEFLSSSSFKQFLNKYCSNNGKPAFGEKCDAKKIFEQLPYYNLAGELFSRIDTFIEMEKMLLSEKDNNKVQILDNIVTDFYRSVEELNSFEDGALEILLENVFTQINVLDNNLSSYLDSLSIWAVSHRDFSNYIDQSEAKKGRFSKNMLPLTFLEYHLSFYKQFVSDNADALNKISDFLIKLHEIAKKVNDGVLAKEDLWHIKQSGQKISIRSLSELVLYVQGLEDAEINVPPIKDLL